MPTDWVLARDYAARDVRTKEMPVTEAEWLIATDPVAMLDDLRGKASDRKLRLFACARCHHVWHLLTGESNRKAVEIAEQHADRLATTNQLRVARKKE
jgi:hypothetical protein